ncbi:MAG: hypothetical protein LBB19_02225 [Puniceicoccales bacterium]|nr:hypothetical protein [Puniceicoccales bacterium]
MPLIRGHCRYHHTPSLSSDPTVDVLEQFHAWTVHVDDRTTLGAQAYPVECEEGYITSS